MGRSLENIRQTGVDRVTYDSFHITVDVKEIVI
jgi:2-phospho-L-lactate guanylyltransferase (CobY/MobA/RfbA family)